MEHVRVQVMGDEVRHGWRGDVYLSREGAVRTYRIARARARALKPSSWLHYLELATEHNLPTQPQTLWPEEWEAGGRYAGFLGVKADHETIEERGLASATEIRAELGIGHATWKLISEGLKPAATIRHKTYFDPARARDHMLAHLDRIRRADAREALRKALVAWRG